MESININDNNEEKVFTCLPEDIEKQIEIIKRKDDAISSSIEDIMIDLHNNCEFMGNKMSSLIELVKNKTEEEIKASTVNYRKAYETLLKVAMMIGILNSVIIIMIIFLLLK